VPYQSGARVSLLLVELRHRSRAGRADDRELPDRTALKTEGISVVIRYFDSSYQIRSRPANSEDAQDIAHGCSAKARFRNVAARSHDQNLRAPDFSERAYHEWCQKDTSFAAQSLRARATGRMRIVDSILADKDWRARAWYLERCYPAEFS
jgi:hypothetical protein